MSQTPPDMKVRLSAELRRRVEEAARENNRTLNSEIVFRLEASFGDVSPSRDGALVDRLAELERSQIVLLGAFGALAEKVDKLSVK